MVKCHNCGAPILEEAKFCSKCGAPKSVEEVIVEIEEPVKQSIKPAKSTKKFLNKKTVILAGILVLGAGIGFGAKKGIFSSNSGASMEQKSKKESKQKAKQPISFKNGNGFGLMDQNLNIINEDIGQSPVVFNEFNVGVAFQDGEATMINTKGDKIIDDSYGSIGQFNSPKMGIYEMIRMQSKNGTMDFTITDESSDDYKLLSGLIDVKGNVVLEASERMISPFYGKTMTTFYKNSKTGVVNEDGDIVVEAINDQAVVLSDKLIAVKKDHDNSTFKIMNLKGEIVEETSFENIYSDYGRNDYFIVTNTLGKVGIIDGELNEIIPQTLTSSPMFSIDNKYFTFGDDSEYGIRTIQGETIIEPSYDFLSSPNENGVVSFSKDKDTYGLMTLEEEIIDDSFETNVFPAYMTNLFYSNSNDSDEYYITVYNDKGEELATQQTIPANNPSYVTNTFQVAIYTGENISEENPLKQIVFNKDGLVLSEGATFLLDLGENVLIQENEHIKLVNKNNGKIIKETDL
ncbi:MULTISPECIES: zinc ribbon domain-containing protein [Vagococcus]|uniref:zinc ribbon domain-containing protein n=1 Tax=Vagococcus TaxID=2737 RepID=UPI002FC6BDCA